MPHAKSSNPHRALALIPVRRRHGKVLALLLALPLTTPLAVMARDGGFPVAAPVEATPGKLIAQGRASWYGLGFHGRRTASGDIFDMHGLTAAHRTLPFGTRLRVRSVATGKEVVVRVTDRGPFAHQRIIDLSLGAARALGVQHRGVTEVQLIKE